MDTAVLAHAAGYGWAATTTQPVRVAMRVLLGLRASEATPIQASEVQQLTRLSGHHAGWWWAPPMLEWSR
jgi:hypothetical protein